MKEKIFDFIKKYHMLDDCDRVVLGLSGGADSVCLLYVLHQLIKDQNMPVELVAVHINHGIRGEEALRDEAFAENLCGQLGVAYVCRKVDIPVMAREGRMTEEEAGRKARYAVFHEIAGEDQRTKIAVAHHMNDQAETVLMNIIRGSSLTGLCGMQPVRDRIIRPLLCVTRSEIEQYLKRAGQAYITDSTNQDNAYTRNRLRNELVPYIQEHINGNVINRISDMAASVSEAEDYIRSQALQAYAQSVTCPDENGKDIQKSVCIRLSAFDKMDAVIQKYVVRMALEKLSGACKDIYRTHIEDVTALARMQAGKRMSLPYGITAVRRYEDILLIREGRNVSNRVLADSSALGMPDHGQAVAEIKLDEIPETGVLRLPVGRFVYTERQGYVFVRNIVLEYVETLAISEKNDYTKYFDCDKMRHTICVCPIIRFRQNGDRIVVDSAGVSKKLKKEFIDRKIPCDDRNSVLLLAVEQKILWAVGVRRSEEYKVQDCSGKILKISVELQEEE